MFGLDVIIRSLCIIVIYNILSISTGNRYDMLDTATLVLFWKRNTWPYLPESPKVGSNKKQTAYKIHHYQSLFPKSSEFFRIFFVLGPDGWLEHGLLPALPAAAAQRAHGRLWSTLADPNDLHGRLGRTSSGQSGSLHHQQRPGALGLCGWSAYIVETFYFGRKDAIVKTRLGFL